MAAGSFAVALLATACASRTPAPMPASSALPPSLAGNLLVNTNEPFWQALVEGNRVVLTGPEVSRALDVTSDTATADGRRVVARDSQGIVEVVVSERPCQDSMSGAAFPLTGQLLFVGRGVAGCARPADMPPPRVP